MADSRITELPVLNKAGAAATDVLPIADVSASTTKKISIADLVAAGVDFISDGEIDLSKLDQNSVTKLTSTALSNTGVIAGTYGGAGEFVSFTVDAKGRITGASEGNISVNALNVAGLAQVALTGSYTDLINEPAIGTIAGQNANNVNITGGSISGITDLAVADGGTGASTAAQARTNLGIGTIATQNSNSVAITGGSIAGITDLAITDGGTGASTAADARTNLGLGSIATQNANTVAITGGSIAGITDLAIADGGTGASTAADARNNLGLEIGADVQAWDVALEAISGVSPAANTLAYFDSANTAASTSLSAFGRSLIDDTDAASARSTLGLGSAATANATIANGSVVSGANTGDQTIVLSGDATGSGTSGITVALSNTGVTPGTYTSVTVDAKGRVTTASNPVAPIALGGTGAANAAAARDNLGLEIGADVQAWDIALDAISSITPSTDRIPYFTGSTTAAAATLTAFGRSLIDDADAQAARSTLGLGSAATANATIADGSTLSGSNTGDQVITLTGDATGSGTSGITVTLANSGVVAGTYRSVTVDSKGRVVGGTNPTTLSGYGIVDAQPLDADLTAIAGLSGTSGLLRKTDANTWALDTTGYLTQNDVITVSGAASGSGRNAITLTLSDNSVTAAKLADNSAVIVSGIDATGTGDFVGQKWINSNTDDEWYWDGTAWVSQAAVETIAFNDTSPLSFSSSVSSTTATITVGVEDQLANTFWAGATSGGLSAPTFRSIVSADLPVANASSVGAVKPGTALSVALDGTLNHATYTAGTFTKVTTNTEGHVVSGSSLTAADIPSLDASKITTGQFGTAFLADSSVTAAKIADSGLIKMGNVGSGFPVPDFMGQLFIDSNNGVYVFAGIDVTNGMWIAINRSTELQFQIRWGGTYDVAGDNIETVNSSGADAGLVTGSALPAPTTTNAGIYLLVANGGTGSGNAPVESYDVGDWVLSIGTEWIKIDVIAGGGGSINAETVLFSPAIGTYSDLQAAATDFFNRTRIATTSAVGVIRASSSIAVDSVSGVATVDVIDEGTY